MHGYHTDLMTTDLMPRPSPDAIAVLDRQIALSRRWVLASVAALAVLSVAWEFWLAPLRPGGSMLALKALPLVLALPPLRASRLRTYQAWSMGILLYLCEGLVRATTDRGLSATLAAIETLLAAIAFAAILVHVRARRLTAMHDAKPRVS
jgi:uncharacterized membrane protein